MKWLRAYFEFPFKVLAVLVWIFRFNRAWLAAGLARKPAAVSLRGLTILTFLAWLVIWLLNVL